MATRNIRSMMIAKSAGTVFVAALGAIATTAAADEVTVKNNRDQPVKIVIKKAGQEVGRSNVVDGKSSGKVIINPGVYVTRCSAATGDPVAIVMCEATEQTREQNPNQNQIQRALYFQRISAAEIQQALQTGSK